MPTPKISLPDPSDPEVSEPASLAGLSAEAQRAKEKARIALEGAIYAKGARHTKRKIENGHKQLDKGNDLLYRSNRTDEAVLLKAIQAFEKAEMIFLKAKETAFRIEHSKPDLRVH